MKTTLVRDTIIKDHPVRIYERSDKLYYAEVDNMDGKIEHVTDAYAKPESAYNEAMDFMMDEYPEMFEE